MSETDLIIKQETAILTPSQYEDLRSHMKSQYYPILCDALLLSGMRPIEFSRFQPEWYKASRRVIKLPDGACLKQKCEFKERTINLSLAGCDAFDKLLSTKVTYKKKETPIFEMLPKKVSFRDTLQRYSEAAGLGTEGISPKMFRKTLVSWLVACFPEKSLYIQASMGHSEDTIVQNYLGLGFTKDEVEIMKTKYLNEWGERA
jgi:integrase